MAEFVLGTVQLGLEYGAANRTGKPSRAAARALIQRAVDFGVRQIDTARGYGDAEDRLGEALSGRPVFTVTKLSPLSDLDDGASVETVMAAVDASVARSCAALRRDRLDALLLHRAAHLTQFGGLIWQRLLAFQAAGTIRRLGVSVQTPDELHQALMQPAVQHIQMPFNLLDWRWRDAGLVETLTERPDVVVHVRSIFLQGLLAADDPALWPAIAGVDPVALLGEIARLARDLDRESAADLCLAYARAQDFIDGVVTGLETEAQLEENLRLASKAPLTAAQCRRIEDRLPRVPETLLNPALWPKR